MYLAFIMEIQAKNNKDFVVEEVLQWGEVMQKVIKVDLAPYQNFAELLQNGEPDFTMVEKMRGKMTEVKQRIELKKAIYGDQADLGNDDIMQSDSESAVFARTFIKDLSKHVQFSEEEQKKIDDIED